mgnify:CR=1 FL=1
MSDSIFAENFKPEPYWWHETLCDNLSSIKLPRKVDVAVIGSGFTGCSAALTLARGGREVLILEANQPGYGASSRNGGYVAKVSMRDFSDLVRRIGLERTIRLYNEGKEARYYLESLIEREQIACHYKSPGRLTAAHCKRAYEFLERELEFKRRHVKFDAHMVSSDYLPSELGSDYYCGGLVTNDAGDLHPGEYVSGLVRQVLSTGASIAAHTPVVELEQQKGGVHLLTPRGVVVAKDVILATNGHTPRGFTYFSRRIIPLKLAVLATETLTSQQLSSAIPRGRTVIDTRAMFNAFRPAPDDSRLIYMAEPGINFSHEREAALALHKRMSAVFPQLSDVKIFRCWTGTLGMTFDFMPHIGKRGGVHFALGMNGAGVITGTWLGYQLALRILGKARQSVFDGENFPTLPGYRGKPWFLPLVTARYRLRDFLARH